MGLTQHDLKPFVGQWMRVGGHDGYCEGVLAGVSKTAVRLNPTLVLLEGVPTIMETSISVLALGSVSSVRVFPQVEAVELVERVQKQIAEAREALQRPGSSPATGDTLRPGQYL